MNKMTEGKVPHVRDAILLSPSFLTNLRIAIRTTSQKQFNVINAHLDLLLEAG